MCVKTLKIVGGISLSTEDAESGFLYSIDLGRENDLIILTNVTT
jgi:hypothetical protein